MDEDEGGEWKSYKVIRKMRWQMIRWWMVVGEVRWRVKIRKVERNREDGNVGGRTAWDEDKWKRR